MLQKEDNILINNLLKELERRQISIPDFAKQVNIPVARVYKWKQRGGGIKGDDALTVSNWLKVDKVPQETDRLNLLEARIAVLTGAMAEMISATSGENAKVVEAKLDKAASDLVKLS